MFLLDYLTSAQYLELDIFYWNWIICDKLQAGYPVVFPNLHTVFIENPPAENNLVDEFETLPAHALPALQHLSISEGIPLNYFEFSTHWATLTHLCLRSSVSSTWLSLIRAIPHLQWGYFEITCGYPPFGITPGTPPPPQCTLLELTTLTVVVRGKLERNSVFPLSFLFTDLHLPALRALSLSSPGANAREDSRARRELYAVLRSTPAVTKLALEDQNRSWDPHHDAPLIPLPAVRDAEPIWRHATELAHIQLAVPARFTPRNADCEEGLALFVRDIFSSDSVWLDLQNPACPVRTVTISNNGVFHRISELTMGGIRESAAEVLGVMLEVAESVELVAADVQKEWGLRI